MSKAVEEAEAQARRCESLEQQLKEARGDDGLMPYARILELCNEFEITDTDTLKHSLEDHARWRREIVALSIRSERTEKAEAALRETQEKLARLEQAEYFGNKALLEAAKDKQALEEKLAQAERDLAAAIVGQNQNAANAIQNFPRAEAAEHALASLREAVQKLKRGDCWCEVAIGNPMYRGEHTPVCLTLQKMFSGAPSEETKD